MPQLTATELLKRYKKYIDDQGKVSIHLVKSATAFLRRKAATHLAGEIDDGLTPAQELRLSPYFIFLDKFGLSGFEIENDLENLQRPILPIVQQFFSSNVDFKPHDSIVHTLNKFTYELVSVNKNWVSNPMEEFVRNNLFAGFQAYQAKVLKAYLAWLGGPDAYCIEWVKNNIAQIDLAHTIVLLNGKENISKKTPSPDEIIKMVEMIPDVTQQLMLSLMVNDGVQENELHLLKGTDIDLMGKQIITHKGKYTISVTTSNILKKWMATKTLLSASMFDLKDFKSLHRSIRVALDSIGRKLLNVTEFLNVVRPKSSSSPTSDVSADKTNESDSSTKEMPVLATGKKKRKIGRKPNLELRRRLNLD